MRTEGNSQPVAAPRLAPEYTTAGQRLFSAEGVGFEPTVALRPHTLSRRAESSALASLPVTPAPERRKSRKGTLWLPVPVLGCGGRVLCDRVLRTESGPGGSSSQRNPRSAAGSLAVTSEGGHHGAGSMMAVTGDH